MTSKKKFKSHLSKTQVWLIYSAIGALGFSILGLIISVVYKNSNFLYNFLLISIFILIFPVFLLKYLHFRDVRECETYFPNFLDDLKEAKNSGVSFPQAIMNCRGEYGALNQHVRKLQQDISWEISIDDALKQMKKNLDDSRILSRSITVLLETYRSGGNVENILETLRGSLLKIMESEDYRKAIMQQHVMMMYGVFLMYIVLIIMLGHFLIPMLDQMGAGSTDSNLGGLQLMTVASPCDGCSNPFCGILCKMFQVVAGMFGFGTNPLHVYYKSLFFLMTVTQGFFSGIIAGQISGKSWLEGLKHGFIMMFAGMVIIVAANALGFF
ncbi:MAG: type II secretion system F family protein [Candidatus Aenigmarchaeota archaeon]|nr:type II secretion system F family protein [Candidatus Aenigmarchaeota archaeon]